MRSKEEIFKELQMYKLTKDGMQHVTIACAERLISEVFDDFEGRTCEGCKLNNVCGVSKLFNLTKDTFRNSPEVEIIKDFGCNKWEAKDENK